MRGYDRGMLRAPDARRALRAPRPMAAIAAIAGLYRDAFSGLSRPVWLLGTANLVNRSGTMVLPFMALFLTAERGFSVTDAGRALAVYGVGAVGGAYLGGWWSDRSSPLTVMRASLLATGAGFLVLGWVERRSAIFAVLLLLSVVGETFRPAGGAAIATASAPGERTKAYALHRLAVNLGMTLGPALGGFLAGYGYRWLFLVDGATCAAAAGLLWLFFPRGLPRPAASEGGAAAVEEAPAARSPWRDPPFLALMFLMFLFAVVLFQLSGTYPLMLRDHYGMTELRIGLVLGLNALIVALFEMVLVHSLGAAEPLRMMAVGCLVLCLGFGMLPFGSTFGFAALTVVVWSVGEMLSMPAAGALVANRAGEGTRGSYMGVYMLSFALAFVIAPLAGSWLYEDLGPRVLWLSCAALGPVLGLALRALAPAFRGGRAASAPGPQP
jgi:predicted MFS family arabinose efflux permease